LTFGGLDRPADGLKFAADSISAIPDHDLAVGARRFPAPWRADKMPGGYVVRDANGLALI
jgi:hypothetical protein